MPNVKLHDVTQLLSQMSEKMGELVALLETLDPSTRITEIVRKCAPIWIDPPRLDGGCMVSILSSVESEVSVQDFLDTAVKLDSYFNSILEYAEGLNQNINLPGITPQP